MQMVEVLEIVLLVWEETKEDLEWVEKVSKVVVPRHSVWVEKVEEWVWVEIRVVLLVVKEHLLTVLKNGVVAEEVDGHHHHVHFLEREGKIHTQVEWAMLKSVISKLNNQRDAQPKRKLI